MKLSEQCLAHLAIPALADRDVTENDLLYSNLYNSISDKQLQAVFEQLRVRNIQHSRLFGDPEGMLVRQPLSFFALLELYNLTAARKYVGSGLTVLQFWGRDFPVKRTGLSNDIDTWLKNLSISSARRDLEFSVATECRHAIDHGWFTIFDTLTIRENAEGVRKESFFQGDQFRDFISLARLLVAKAVYPELTARQRRQVPASDYFRWASVIEGGDDNPHVHVLVFMADIPSGWKCDPNRGLSVPRNRLCKPMMSLWAWGFSLPKIFRIDSRFDAWARCGHVWPCVKGKDGYSPMADYGPVGAGSYVAKYAGKEMRCKDGKTIRRIRKSILFGQTTMAKAVADLATSELETVKSMKLETPSILRRPGVTPSSGKLRLLIDKELLRRNLASCPCSTILNTQTIAKRETLFEHLKASQVQTVGECVRLLQRLRVSAAASLSKVWQRLYDALLMIRTTARYPSGIGGSYAAIS